MAATIVPQRKHIGPSLLGLPRNPMVATRAKGQLRAKGLQALSFLKSVSTITSGAPLRAPWREHFSINAKFRWLSSFGMRLCEYRHRVPGPLLSALDTRPLHPSCWQLLPAWQLSLHYSCPAYCPS
eukprot:SM000106S13955  [mRNA]  locus=s106:154840:155451:+ [translate_table: standard]